GIDKNGTPAFIDKAKEYGLDFSGLVRKLLFLIMIMMVTLTCFYSITLYMKMEHSDPERILQAPTIHCPVIVFLKMRGIFLQMSQNKPGSTALPLVTAWVL